MAKGKVHYFDPAQWPIHIGFTRDEEAFKREMKRLKVANAKFMPDETANAATIVLTGDNSYPCILITLGETKGRTMAQIAALIAHEAVHVAQQLWQHIGEQNVGDETEAYFIQWVTQSCLETFDCFEQEATLN